MALVARPTLYNFLLFIHSNGLQEHSPTSLIITEKTASFQRVFGCDVLSVASGGRYVISGSLVEGGVVGIAK
jgi:hypothetical protein